MFNYIQRRHKMATSVNDAPLRTHFLSEEEDYPDVAPYS